MSDILKRLEDLQRKLKQADTDRSKAEGQLEQLNISHKELVNSLKEEGFNTPEEARVYIENELSAIEKDLKELHQTLSPILTDA